MKRTAFATVLVGLLLVQLQPSYAEPGPVGQWLMKEPVTMWTFGMGQLRNHFDSLQTPELQDVVKAVDYGWDQNRIMFQVVTDEAYSEERCAKILEAIRLGGLVKNGRIVFLERRDHTTYAGS